MKQKALAYAKAALVVAVIFVGFPLITYVFFEGAQGTWDAVSGAFASTTAPAGSIGGGSALVPRSASSFLGMRQAGGLREAKKIERDIKKTVSRILIFGIIMAVFVVVTAARMQIGLTKNRKRREKETKRRRARVHHKA